MEIQFVRLSNLYHSTLIRTIRLLLVFFIIAGLYAGIVQNYFPKFTLFSLIWLIIIEVFMHYKIGKVRPALTVEQNTTDPTKSCTMPVISAAISSFGGFDFVQRLSTYPSITFFLERIGITKGSLEKVDITNEQLVEKALEIVKSIKGSFITPPDILTAYLYLTEDTTKLLFKNEVKKDDLISILKWTRDIFRKDEVLDNSPSGSTGGLVEELLTGWTPETKNFTRDIWNTAFSSSPQITGREKEYELMIETLEKTNNNNILLVGDIGSGKENLVNLLELESQKGLLPEKVNNKRVIELLVGPLLAGASDKGELEKRIQAVIDEVAHAGNIILFIPELQNILGSSSYGLDLSGVLLPHLKNGELPIIATMSKGTYKSYFEKNPLKEAFEAIILPEPSIEEALEMVFHKTTAIEAKFRVLLTYTAVKQAVSLADRYFPDNALPGSAITLLEDVANTVSVEKNFANTGKKLISAPLVIRHVQDKTHVAVAAPNEKEKELLLHLEEKLKERIIDQDEAVEVISEALRRLRSGLASTKKPISFLFLGPTGVGKTETAKALADIYYGGQSSILRLDMSEYTGEDGAIRLLGAPPGQGEERGELTDKIHDNPASLVLLDEFEKASPKIRDLFLQVLEDGRLTDNKGRTVSFLNALIIATSNAGSEFIREELGKGTPADNAFKHKLLNQLQEQHIFTPELINRFDDTVVFRPLGLDGVKQIAKLSLISITKALTEDDITIRFDDSVIEKIATEGQDVEFGARPILRFIQDNIDDKIAKAKLQDQIKRGDHVVMKVGLDGEIKIDSETVA